MTPVQQQILDGIRSALVLADTMAQHRVFLDRLDPLEAGDLPALLVEASPDGEVIEPASTKGLQQRVFPVTVTAVVAHATGYGVLSRELGGEVEACMGASSFAIPKPGRAQIAASRPIRSGEGDQARAALMQTWQITYFTRRGAPDIAY